MSTLKLTLRKKLNSVLAPTGLQLTRSQWSHLRDFQPLGPTLRRAKATGLSVGDYIDKTFQSPGATQGTIDKLKELAVFDERLKRICEVGPGTGRYLEKVLPLCQSDWYEIYETDREWSEWLGKQFPQLTVRFADGLNLKQTPDASIALLHAHKVITYLSFVNSWIYFKEFVRVIKPHGTIVFDLVTEACMTEDLIDKWINIKMFYPTMFPIDMVTNFFAQNGCKLVGRFFAPMKPGISEYLIFKKYQ
jgi:hypothetical protein